jgi:3-hydroxyacyl-CoA dehydrogenase/3a,7a,12a-trihydroxy-5b-cholest-24-enoyl-CoA hydratase
MSLNNIRLRFDERVALVTGAGRGLGRAHALLLASRGARVVVNDLGGAREGTGADSTPAESVVAEIHALGGEAVANTDSVLEGEKIVQCALDHFGRLDIVINNAGNLRDVSFAKMSHEDWESVLSVHLHGSFRVTLAAWPHLRALGYGRLIFTTSASGIYGNFGQAHYAAAKMGLIGLSYTLAQEGKKYNILVNAIAPLAGSRMTETILPPEVVAALKPEYVSPLVAYLCHESTQETGGIYEVGAGWVAKIRWQRSAGVFLPLEAGIQPEDIAAHWGDITNWDAPEYPQTLQSSLEKAMRNLA